MTAIAAALLPVGLMLLMLVVGLRLSPGQVVRAFMRPRGLLVGLVVQMLSLPLLAFVLVRLFGLAGPMAVGLILVAAAPGGITSNYIAHLVRADLALSAAMTLVTTLLAALSIPLVLALAGLGALQGAGGLLRISLAMGAVALAPMALGMGFGWWRPALAARVLKVLEPASKLIFGALVIATFVQNWAPMRANFASVGPAVVALNLGALALALAAGWLAGLGRARIHAVMVEASLQNVAVALFVAGSLLGDPRLTIPALIYALVMNLTALGHIALAQMAPAGAEGKPI